MSQVIDVQVAREVNIFLNGSDVVAVDVEIYFVLLALYVCVCVGKEFYRFFASIEN